MRVFGGVLSLFGGLCFCELGTFIKKSGGEDINLKLSHGRFVGFLNSGANVLFLEPSSFAIVSFTFGVYPPTRSFPAEAKRLATRPAWNAIRHGFY